MESKIVYPYGLTLDLPLKRVYWVDTYLDYIEAVDYDGGNRKTILRGELHTIVEFHRRPIKGPLILLCQIISEECPPNFEFGAIFSIVVYALDLFWFVFDLV